MKPKFAMYWAASCGGCEIAVLNTDAKVRAPDLRLGRFAAAPSANPI